MHAADIAVLVVYFIGIAALGVYMARKVRRMGDFIMPRKFGKAMMIMHGFGTGTHSDHAVSVSSKTFTNGLSGVWVQWLWLFSSPFYWLIAPVMRRFRALTTADVFEARYDRGVAGLFAGVGLLQYTVKMGTMLLGSAKVIDACTGGAIPTKVAIPAMTVLFVVYGVAGGLSAAIVTDFIQGILTIIFSFLLLPFVLDAVGWMDGLRDGLADMGREEMLGITDPEITIFFIVVISLNALIGIVTQPHTMGNCAAGKTEFEGQVGFMGGSLLKRVCTVAWCLTGLAAVVYFRNQNVEADKAFGMVAGEFLTRIGWGVLGLFIASLLAAVMSSCDSFMIASAGLLTQNVYKPLRPGRSDRHYLLVARLSSLGVVAVGVVLAYTLKNVMDGLELFWKVAAMMGIAFWLGLFWRRATVAAAWASTLAAFAVLLLSMQSFFVRFLGSVWGGFVAGEGSEATMYLPWQMIFYLVVGLVVGITVSLYTKPVDDEKLDRFYALVRTPVKEGEEVPEPCTLPEGVRAPPSRPLLPRTKLEIQVPRARSFIGFGVGWAIVIVMILVFVWIAKG